MFNFKSDNSTIQKIKFSWRYLTEVSILFSIVYCVPFLLIAFYKDISPMLFVIIELIFVLVSAFFMVLHINIFKFSIEILDDKLIFNCLKTKICLNKSDIKNFGIIRRAGTAFSINPYSTSTIYFSSVEIESSKLYKALWQKHVVGCGVIDKKYFSFLVMVNL